jgi:hypothetical protein
MPVEVTAQRSGPAASCHGRTSVPTWKRVPSTGHSGFHSVKCGVGTRVRWCSIRTHLISPATPAAVLRCPMLALTEPRVSGVASGTW